jgi:indolepyruvate ferredoxin oxidoreductase
VTNVADGYATIDVGPERVSALTPPSWDWNGKPWAHTQEDDLFGPGAVRMEHEVFEGRLEAVERFVAHNGLNRSTVDPTDARLGFVAAGTAYHYLRGALDKLGFDEATLHRRGIRIFKPAVLWPLERESLKRFAAGLDTVVVVEEKRSFVEMLTREVLYNLADRPQVLGKELHDGSRWFPAHGEIDADVVAAKLEPFLIDRFGSDAVTSVVKPREARQKVLIPVAAATPGTGSASRMAGFCSGCPHNTSTQLPEGSETGGGIGCHGMSALRDDRATYGVTQMGGEGAQWVGAAPFVTLEHRFQNIGDGTYHHSGSLSLRQAVAAGTNITFKILYNNAVAMTGGQPVDGQMQVPELTRSIEAEGVAKIMVVTDDVDKYPSDARFAPDVTVWDRSRLDEAQRILRDIPGTTVLIYDQACAAELRRDRKRGKVAEPPMRVFINEAVCEGCGDCGVKSSCLSVQPVDTEFGRKTQIHQPSCNKDYSCLLGDCPAFVEVIPDPNHKPSSAAKGARPAGAVAIESGDLPEPDRVAEGNILLMGIGGTGVVTVNQVLGTAALLDGKRADGLDQTGLSQKGGSVVSNLQVRLAHGSEPEPNPESGGSGKLTSGSADAYLVFDILTGVNPVNLDKASPDRSVAVVSSTKVPTGVMVRDVTKAGFPEWAALQATVESATRADDNVYLNARGLSEAVFGSDMQTNLLVVGAAYQKGVIPISAEAIEAAIELNGVAVTANTQAFRLGRKVALEPAWADELLPEGAHRAGSGRRPGPTVSRSIRKLIDRVPEPSAELTRLLEIRVPELVAYQDRAWAERYIDEVVRLRTRELTWTGASVEGASVDGAPSRLSEAYARYLFKLMTYKDEYEVARLYRSTDFGQALDQQFGRGAQITYKLHPPIMRRLGYHDKIGLGRSGDVAFAALARMKRLRGTAADPFGRTAHRRMERALIDDYIELVDQAVNHVEVDRTKYGLAVELAELPDVVRGYETIKEANVAEFRSQAQILLGRLAG